MKNIKIILTIVMVLLAVLLIGCTDKTDETQSTETQEPMETEEQMPVEKEETPEPEEPKEQPEDSMEKFTLEELSKYDGVNSNKAYVAYNGDVYDVTDVPQWKSGSHGGNMAGTDITEMLDAAPHGISKLNGLKMVGKLID